MQLSWIDFVDVLIVAFVLYQAMLLLKGTRAVQLLRGFLIVLLIYIVGRTLGLHTINWLMERFATAVLIMLIVVFQPELRRTLEKIGRGRLLEAVMNVHQPPTLVRHVMRAVEYFSENKMGALIVLERETGLTEYIESGEQIDAALSAELLISIFSTRSPLHDGAVIIRGGRIAACGCLLPLSESRALDRRLGTRHRAALGLVEQTDALAIIVSEFSGIISFAENGLLNRYLTREVLEEKLLDIYQRKTEGVEALPWIRNMFRKKSEAEPSTGTSSEEPSVHA